MLLRFSGAFGANGSVFLPARFFCVGFRGRGRPGGVCALSLDSAGGELILGWRESALFFKKPLSERHPERVRLFGKRF